jgi:D-3-phosphoglycerate dehydrogenase / 2-oxoglutarate reductase
VSAIARKRVGRFDYWIDAAFDDRLRREPDVEIVVSAMPGSEDGVVKALEGAHVYHVSAAKDELPSHGFVTAGLLSRCPDLVCVSSTGAGYDPIDVAACTEAGVAVVNQAGGNAVSVAEHALGLLLSVSRRIGESDRRLRAERGFSREDLMGREIAGKVIGLVGIGHVGTRTAALAHAFGLRVLAYDPYLTEEEIARRGAESVPFDELLSRSDFVSLHCPRDRTTMRMIDAAAFARMKAGALFITTARGGIHDEGALLDALASGHLGGAGIDVWDREPPPLDHPLLARHDVVATFHTAGVTREARRNMAAIAAEQIVGVLKGGRPPRLVNPEVWPAYAARFESVMKLPVQQIHDTTEE